MDSAALCGCGNDRSVGVAISAMDLRPWTDGELQLFRDEPLEAEEGGDASWRNLWLAGLSRGSLHALGGLRNSVVLVSPGLWLRLLQPSSSWSLPEPVDDSSQAKSTPQSERSSWLELAQLVRAVLAEESTSLSWFVARGESRLPFLVNAASDVDVCCGSSRLCGAVLAAGLCCWLEPVRAASIIVSGGG